MRRRFALHVCAALAFFLPALAAAPGSAHEVRPATLEINEGPPGRYAVRLREPLLRGGARRALNLRVHFPAHCDAPSPARTAHQGRTLTERFEVHCPGGIERPAGAGSDAAWAGAESAGTPAGPKNADTQAGAESAGMQMVRIEGLRESITDVYVTFRPARGAPQNFLLNGARPAFRPGAGIRPEAGAWFRLGMEHLLGGFDHVLFVLGLLLLASSTLRLVLEVTAFTLAHSITLALATLEWVHPRTGPVEAGISLSILFLAFELTRPQQAVPPGLSRRRPEAIAFAFGLLHGLGFAGALAQTGLPEGALLPALFFFNVGIEAGQLLVVAGGCALLFLLGRAGDAWLARGRAVLIAALGVAASYFFTGSLVSLFRG